MTIEVRQFYTDALPEDRRKRRSIAIRESDCNRLTTDGTGLTCHTHGHNTPVHGKELIDIEPRMYGEELVVETHDGEEHRCGRIKGRDGGKTLKCIRDGGSTEISNRDVEEITSVRD